MYTPVRALRRTTARSVGLATVRTVKPKARCPTSTAKRQRPVVYLGNESTWQSAIALRRSLLARRRSYVLVRGRAETLGFCHKRFVFSKARSSYFVFRDDPEMIGRVFFESGGGLFDHNACET